MDFKPSLLADLGATNARFAITEDGLSYHNPKELKISEYNSMRDLCMGYLSSIKITNIRRAFIGVAAPVIGDVITFVNCDLEFSQYWLNSKSQFTNVMTSPITGAATPIKALRILVIFIDER